MKNIIVPIGASIIIYVVGYMVTKRKSIESWMAERRIEPTSKDDSDIKLCGVCGNEMKLKTRLTGEKVGEMYWVCSDYPDCRKVEKCE